MPLLSILLFQLIACAETPPQEPVAQTEEGSNVARIETPTHPVRVHDARPIELDLRALDKQSRRVPGVEVEIIKSSAPDVVSLDGAPHCARSGRSRVTASAGGASAQVDVVCQLTLTIQV